MFIIPAPTNNDQFDTQELVLHGGTAEGLRGDPEKPMVVRRRPAANGRRLIEIEIDEATSGFDNIAWLSTAEAIAFAEMILRAAVDTDPSADTPTA